MTKSVVRDEVSDAWQMCELGKQGVVDSAREEWGERTQRVCCRVMRLKYQSIKQKVKKEIGLGTTWTGLWIV